LPIDVSEQNPPKQGLKQMHLRLFRKPAVCFRAKSTKTRIETPAATCKSKMALEFQSKIHQNKD